MPSIAVLVLLSCMVQAFSGASDGSRTFTITLNKTNATVPIGVDIYDMDQPDTATMFIRGLKKAGLVAEWNKENPDHEVIVNDSIISVNGVNGSRLAMADVVRKMTSLEMVIQRNSQVCDYVVHGAGGVGSSANGCYKRVGKLHEAGMYRIVGGQAIMFLTGGEWKINIRNETTGWYYSKVMQETSEKPPAESCHESLPPWSESMPPEGVWTTLGYGKTDAEPPPTVSKGQQLQ